MRIDISELSGIGIAELHSNGIEIKDAQDALDLMADCGYRGARNIILYKENITPDFIDLKTGIAGEILQKFSNYNVRLSIVGDFTEFNSKSLNEFIYESNRTGRIFFVGSVMEAKEKFRKLA